ncbi:hypothetical protein HDV06_002857 [Boothiomyces sp. JEL0866]|nr:hypothetical protein HDV06_002857 [Boothiomyces sp. JEL0866]
MDRRTLITALNPLFILGVSCRSSSFETTLTHGCLQANVVADQTGDGTYLANQGPWDANTWAAEFGHHIADATMQGACYAHPAYQAWHYKSATQKVQCNNSYQVSEQSLTLPKFYTHASFDLYSPSIWEITSKTTSIIGLLGVFSMIYLMYCNELDISKPMGRFMVITTVSDLLDAILKLIGEVESPQGCIAQALFIELEYMLSICTSFTMGFITLYLTFLNGSLNIVLLNHLKLIGLIIGVSTVFGLSILFIPGMITNRDAYCFISSEYPEFQILFFYGWLWIILLANITCISTSVYYLRNSLSSDTSSTRAFIRRLLFFLGSFVIVWLFVGLDNLILYTNGEIFGIKFLKAFFSPLRGLWNFLAYYLSNYFYKQEKSSNLTKSLPNSKSFDFESASSLVKTAKVVTPKIEKGDTASVIDSISSMKAAKDKLVAVNKNYVKQDYNKLHILK